MKNFIKNKGHRRTLRAGESTYWKGADGALKSLSHMKMEMVWNFSP